MHNSPVATDISNADNGMMILLVKLLSDVGFRLVILALLWTRSWFADTAIRSRISAQNQQLALSLNVASDFDRLSNHFENLLVHGSAFRGNQHEINRRAVLLPYEQNRRHTAADAANRTGTICRYRARLWPPIRCRIHPVDSWDS